MMPMLLTERARIISTIYPSFSASCGACKASCEIRRKKSDNCGVVPRAMGLQPSRAFRRVLLVQTKTYLQLS